MAQDPASGAPEETPLNPPPADPEAERPWATHGHFELCPHCGEEASEGHYVCWNCSRDLREPPEEQVYSELESMLAKQEVNIESRNQKTTMGLMIACVLGSLLTVITAPHYWGFHVITGIIFLSALMLWRRSRARLGRIRTTHGM